MSRLYYDNENTPTFTKDIKKITKYIKSKWFKLFTAKSYLVKNKSKSKSK